MTPLVTALAVLLLTSLAEWLHVRRIRAVGRLAFGPAGAPHEWTRIVPFLRPLCLAAFTWGLVTLIILNGASEARDTKSGDSKEATRLIFLADLSPSMYLKDAGKDGSQTRQERMKDVVDGILWVLKTGARWRDLPEGYPSGSTCWRRLRRWDEDGTWLQLWRAFLGQLDARGRLSWENTFIDGSFASAKKGALTSGKPSGARVRSGWWWSTARVFLWEYMSPRPARGKSRSSTRR